MSSNWRWPATGLVMILVVSCGDDGGTALPDVTGGRGAESPAGPPWFADEARERGIDFEHVSGARGEHYMPEVMGGGAALFDMDADGDLDAYLVQSGAIGARAAERPGNQLYRNDGSGHFDNVTASSGADDRGFGCGVAVGDANGDGHPDLFVTNVGPNALLTNDGSGTFTDTTKDAGVAGDKWSSSVGFVDYDHDGDLDAFVCEYLRWSVETRVECYSNMGGLDYCGPKTIDRPLVDTLWQNDGRAAFTDVTEAVGMGDTRGNGLGVVCGDFDTDGWVDVFVANDGMQDRLWINQEGKSFVDKALLFGCAVDENGKMKAGMGVAASDADNDGDLDLVVCNLGGESDSFYYNHGTYFLDSTTRVGLAGSKPFTRFGVGLQDFDNDGRVDLYEASGRVERREKVFSDDPYAEPNQVFRRTAEGKMVEVFPRGGTAELLIATSRAAAFGDVDGDGGVDVLVVNKDLAPYLLMNRVEGRGSWLSLRAVDGGRDALGARVTMSVGGTPITRDVRSAYSYQSASEARVHVGLGSESIARGVKVRWVDGTEETFGDVEGGRVVTLRRGAGK